MRGRTVSIPSRRLSLTLILVCLTLIGTISSTCTITSAQTSTAFTTDTPFSIPAYNATVFFVQGGTYDQASLLNDTWFFKGLSFSDTVTLKSFSVSAHDCNVTLYFSGIFRGYLRAQDSGLLQYNVTGPGVQRFNFGLSLNFAANQKYRDLMVRFSSEFFTNSSEVARMGEGWQLASDGTITVMGAVTGASIFYVDYSNMYNDTTQPFYVQHAVTLGAVAVMLAIAVVGVVLRFRLHKSKPAEAPQ
jgi:hypothetical protein